MVEVSFNGIAIVCCTDSSALFVLVEKMLLQRPEELMETDRRQSAMDSEGLDVEGLDQADNGCPCSPQGAVTLTKVRFSARRDLPTRGDD